MRQVVLYQPCFVLTHARGHRPWPLIRPSGTFSRAQRNLAAALAQTGRVEEALEISSQFMQAVPQFTINSWVASLPFGN